MGALVANAVGPVAVARRPPRRMRHAPRERVSAPRASRADDLPGILLGAAAKKLEEDVNSFIGLFDEDAPTHERPPTLPVAGNTLDIAQGGHRQLLEWAETYGVADGVHEVKMLSLIHI